jgi:hypothetical protein
MRKLSAIKAGDVVEVEFLDHVEDGGEPYAFLVWGVVAVNGKKHYEILSWAHVDGNVETMPSNEKRWTIVKAAVTRITKMIPAL